MGMTLDAIDQQLEPTRSRARALLAEAKASSVKALSELRDLVRGIHPPVLADRGLVEAVRALALDSPLRVASRPSCGPAASAGGVRRLLRGQRAARQCGQACGARARPGSTSGTRPDMLRISVTDDGRGGADQSAAPACAGSRRRLAAFDGVLAVSSPPGGPTVVNLEIPCALSSPKTSSCCGTA